MDKALEILSQIWEKISDWFKGILHRPITTAVILLLLFFIYIGSGKVYHMMFEWYTGVTNAPLTYGAFTSDNGRTIENSRKLSEREFLSLAKNIVTADQHGELTQLLSEENNPFAREVKEEMMKDVRSFVKDSRFKHIQYFYEAGIRQYDGPSTCLKCHKTMKVENHAGHMKEVDTLDDVVDSVHFRFFSMEEGFSNYGYDGREVNGPGERKIPVGKIDRACGIPGSFSWTGWAEIVEAKPEHLHGKSEMRSEGCGQCHIGGNYHPATEMMMPVGGVPDVAKEGIDCLICHSQTYDMNYRFVLEDKHGKRWNQDRTMRAAMTVTNPGNENCLNCHQHNMGGDTHKVNQAAKSLGYKNKRLLHIGSKRANAFSPETDVHYAAGLKCTDCHEPVGHKIPRGNLATDLVANDLPGKEVSCEKCHTTAPHVKTEHRALLNGHTERIACETCHITKLDRKSVVLRDWVHPTWEAEEGVWTPTDIYRNGEPGHGIKFLWYNGKGTFLANALGSSPNKSHEYNPLMKQLSIIDDPQAIAQVRREARDIIEKYNLDEKKYYTELFDVLSQMPPEMREKRAQVIENNLRNIMEMGQSKIYPFKVFNAYMYEDMNNQGPFGAMILPFDYKTYYETGDSLNAVRVATQTEIVKRMYQYPFKMYMMDEFMYYFGVDGWETTFPFDVKGNPRNVEAKWMRQMGTLMVNHGIEKGARDCAECHSSNGILDFEKLGYSDARVRDLTNLRELQRAK